MKFALFLLAITSLMGQDITSLLKTYEKESDLSKKTKNESAGNLIVYTRDDLDRMQVESLKDIFKSLRFFSYRENRLSQPDILNNDPISYYSQSIRIYLNNSELLTATSGSGFLLFGDMEMDFIDHIEIYEGFPSFDFGIEPATVVIRLYTKTPEHDEGGRIKAMFGSYATNKENIYYTNKEDDFSYFMYANRTDSKRDTYAKDAEILRRDKETNRFYGSLANKNHKFELHTMQEDGDAFLGSQVGNTPDNTFIKTKFINATLHSKFMDDTLKINLSYIDAQSTFEYNYDIATPAVPLTHLNRTIKEKSFTGNIKKDFSLDVHDISIGIQYRYKYFDLSDLTLSIPFTPVPQAYDREKIYSLFFQDLISLDKSNMFSISLMNQVYKRDENVDNPNIIQFRLGYIHTSEDWVAKTFLSRQEFVPEPYMKVSQYYGNPDLKANTYESIFQEVSYQTPTTLSKILLGYGTNKGLPVLDSNAKIQNSNTEIAAILMAFEHTFLFRDEDKLEFKMNYTHIESPYGGSSTEHFITTVRMLNTISKFDVFNELQVNGGYSHVQTGYDYTAGVRYALNKDLYLNLKGENIFDSGLEQSYLTQVFPTLGRINVPTVEQRFLISMEYYY